MMNNKTIRTSVNGQKITAQSNFNLDTVHDTPFTLIIGGMHGDERAPVPILENFINRYLETGTIQSPVTVIPVLNPDGYLVDSRYNAYGVDLNRNFPYNWRSTGEEPPGPGPLSEPEAQALYQFIVKYEPAVIINLHWALSEIDADGKQSVALAQRMWDSLDVKEQKQYRLTMRAANRKDEVPCPGSLGQLCGYGLQYSEGKRPAMITLELPYTHENSEKLHPLPENNFDIMVELWKRSPEEYLKAVEPGVHKMLCVGCGGRV